MENANFFRDRWKNTEKSSSEKSRLQTMNNHHHATVNSSTRCINRVNQHKAYRASPSKARYQFNSRPGIFNNFVFLPPSISSCLVNPLFVVNLNCGHNFNSVLLELANLVTIGRQPGRKTKVNEPLLTLTPFLCFFLPPLNAGVNHSMDYYRYLLRMNFLLITTYDRNAKTVLTSVE